MRYTECYLPEYPVSGDMWQELKNESRPILVYGMGNGADKLFRRFEKYGIVPADIFASDGFVRGHTFRGMRVKSFAEVREEYGDFVIVLSFASNREEVLEMLSGIDEKYDMYVPDMPVAGEDEYFDMDFYNSHYTDIKRAYESLADKESKNAFSSIIRYKLSGRMSYLMNCYSEKEELYRELSQKRIQRIIDVGAYNGDTLKESIRYFPELSDAVAIEPDPKNYKRLLKLTNTLEHPRVRAIEAAAWNSVTNASFFSGGNRNSSISSTASFEAREKDVSLLTVDSLDFKCDYIKYDVEGAEMEALEGSHQTIEKYRPTLLVSLYHRSKDIFSITNYLREKYPFYNMYLRRLRCVPAWEIDLILTET